MRQRPKHDGLLELAARLGLLPQLTTSSQYRAVRVFGLNENVTLQMGIEFPAKTDIWFEAQTGAGTSDVSVAMEILETPA